MTNDGLLIFEKYNKLVTEAKKGSMTAPDYYGTQPKGTIHAYGMGKPGAETTKIRNRSIEDPKKLSDIKDDAYKTRLDIDSKKGTHIPLEGPESPLEPKVQDAIKKMTSKRSLDILTNDRYIVDGIHTIHYWNVPNTINALIPHLKIAKQDKNKNNIYAIKELLKFLISFLLKEPAWKSVYANSIPYLDAKGGKSYQTYAKDQYDEYAPKLKTALDGLNSKEVIFPSYEGKDFLPPNAYSPYRIASTGEQKQVPYLRPETPEEKSKTDVNLFQTTTGKKYRKPAVPPQETPTSSQQGKANPATPEQVLRAQIRVVSNQIAALIQKHGAKWPEVKKLNQKLIELKKRLPVNKKLTTESFFKIIPF